MVEAYADGDSTRGYGSGWGPSHHLGDLRGITQQLSRIAELGVNAIWLTPVFDSDRHAEEDDRLDATGYFARDYFSIDPEFGSLEDARRLVDAAHALGLYVFFDGVFGHHKGDVIPSPTGRVPAVAANAACSFKTFCSSSLTSCLSFRSVIFIVLFGECIWDVTGTKNRISDLERNGPKQFRTDHLKEFLAGERKDLKWGYVRLGLSVLFLVLGIFVMVTHFSS